MNRNRDRCLINVCKHILVSRVQVQILKAKLRKDLVFDFRNILPVLGIPIEIERSGMIKQACVIPIRCWVVVIEILPVKCDLFRGGGLHLEVWEQSGQGEQAASFVVAVFAVCLKPRQVVLHDHSEVLSKTLTQYVFRDRRAEAAINHDDHHRLLSRLTQDLFPPLPEGVALSLSD